MTKITLEDIKREYPELKAFLFDLDGTLIDSKEGIVNTINGFLSSKGYNFGTTRIAELFGTPLEVIFTMLIPTITEDEINQYLTEIRAQYATNHRDITSVFPSTEKVLQGIKDQGYIIGIASTKKKRFVIEIMEHFGLMPFFDVIVSGYDVPNHKPAPDILLEAAKQLQLKPGECLYVGDTPNDIEAGKRAGMGTIAVLTGSYIEEHFEAINPDFIIKDLTELQI